MAKKLQPDVIKVDLDINASKAQKEIHNLTLSTKELRAQNVELRKEMNQLAKTKGDHSEEYELLNQRIAENSRQIRENDKEIRKWEQSIDISHKTASQLKRELKELKRQLANTSKSLQPEKYKELEAEIERTEKAYRKATSSSGGFLSSVFSMQKAVAVLKGFFMGLGMVLATQVMGQFGRLKDIIMDFEAANSKLASVLGTNIDGIGRLIDQSKLLGRTTTATASEVTGLQTELAKLGFAQKQIENMTPATLKFAKAVDTDLASAAAFGGAALRMFNKDATQTEELMATFAVATTKSALDFRKLEASLATVGPVADAFGFTVEETTALLGVLSNAGFDASSAATATRNILLNLADANGDLAKALGEPVTNLEQLADGLKKLEEEGVDLNKALELTDKRSVSAFSTFMRQTDTLLELQDAITGATDDFNQMADTMADNATAAYKGFESAVEGLVLKFFNFRHVLKSMFEAATEFVQWIGEIVDAFSGLGSVVMGIVTAFGAVISAAASVVAWFSRLFTQTKLGRTVLNTLVMALVAYKVNALLASNATAMFITKIQRILKLWALQAVRLYNLAKAQGVAAVAQRALNAAMMANPILAVIGLLAMVVAAVIEYSQVTDEAVESTDAWTEATSEASRQYGEQKAKIKALLMVAENEAYSLQKREAAVRRLNKIIPDYNAEIDKTTGKYKASNEQLEIYLASLNKELKYKAAMSKLEKLNADVFEAEDKYAEAQVRAEKAPDYVKKWYGTVRNVKPKREVAEALRKKEEADKALKDFEERLATAINSGTIAPAEEAEKAVDKVTEKVGAKATESVTRLKEIEQELKRLRKIDPTSDEELDRIQKRIELLNKEKRELLGKGGSKREAGTYREDSLDKATAKADDAHQRRLLEINKKDLAETDRIIAKNKEMMRYCGELRSALADLREDTKETHTQTLDKITARLNEVDKMELEAGKNINEALERQDKERLEKSLAILQACYDEQELVIQKNVNDRIITQEAADLYLMKQQRDHNEEMLSDLREYYNKTAAADYIASEKKEEILEQTADKIRQMQRKVLTDSAKLAEMIRQYSENPGSISGMQASIERNKLALTQTYDALLSQVEKGSAEEIALNEEKNRRLRDMDYEYNEQRYRMRESLGLVSWGEEYNHELEMLDRQHEQGLMMEEEYQQKRLALQVQNAKRYFDYYSQLGKSAISALQEAEIAQSEAKYDVLIQQAKNNGEDTAALEQEKENKKLEIQKKYADMDFAVKISQIIADTAVSIMKAYAQLGPLAGPPAAAIIAATGVAQMITAKAERDKIKNMQPGKTGGSSTESAKTATRALTGYAEGGYTGPGGRYEVAGVVHRGEYVVPMPIMKDPRVIDAVGTIEAIRQNRRLTSGSAPELSEGYAEGGFVGGRQGSDMSGLLALLAELKDAITAIKAIRAYVVYKDIEKARKELEKAQAPFTKK